MLAQSTKAYPQHFDNVFTTPKRGAWGQTLAPDPSDRAFKKSKCPQFFGVL